MSNQKTWWQRNVVDRFESAAIAAIVILMVFLFIVVMTASYGAQ